MNILKNPTFVVFGAASLAVSLPANAATLTFTDSIATRSTDWADSFSVTQFDPTLGTLNSATVRYEVTTSGQANTESLDASATTLTLRVGANAELEGTGIVGTIEVTPVSEVVFNASPFDGTVDFGGSSGSSQLGLTDTKSNQAVYSGAMLGPYIGIGSLTFDVTVIANSSADGSGNLVTQFFTSADANVSVTYDYTEAVPEPSTAAMFAIACGGLLIRRRRG